MRVNISKKVLQKALLRVQGVIEKKTSQPILTYVLIRTVGDEKIFVVSTDLKIVMKAEYPATVQNEGEICVSAKMLFDIVREIDNDEILIYSREDGRIIIESGKSVFKLMGIDPDEYPYIKEVDTYEKFSVRRELLLEMINKTVFAVGSDDASGFNFTGVEFKVQRNSDSITLQFAGTDGPRLAYVKREIPLESTNEAPDEQSKKISKFIIPKKTIIETRKMLAEDEGDIIIGLGRKYIVFNMENVEIISRTLDGKYPHYEKIIGETVKKRIYINRVLFERAIRRVSLLTSDITNGVEMAVESDRVILRTENPMVGAAMESIPVEHKGSGMMIGFNYRYMLDVIPEIKSEKVLLEINEYDKPMFVRDMDDADFTYVLMPLTIKALTEKEE